MSQTYTRHVTASRLISKKVLSLFTVIHLITTIISVSMFGQPALAQGESLFAADPLAPADTSLLPSQPLEGSLEDPAPGSHVEALLTDQPSITIGLDQAIWEQSNFLMMEDDLLIITVTGTTIGLSNFKAWANADLSRHVTLKDGTSIPANDILNSAIPDSFLEGPIPGETAAGSEN